MIQDGTDCAEFRHLVFKFYSFTHTLELLANFMHYITAVTKGGEL